MEHKGQNAQDEKTVVGTDVGRAGETVSKENQPGNDHPKFPDIEPEITTIDVKYAEKHQGKIVAIGVDRQDLQIRPSDSLLAILHKRKEGHITPCYQVTLPAVLGLTVDSKQKKFSVTLGTFYREGTILIDGKLTKKMLEILKKYYPKYAKKISEIRLEQTVSLKTIMSYQSAESSLEDYENEIRQIGRIPCDIPHEKLELYWEKQKVYDILRDLVYEPDIRED